MTKVYEKHSVIGKRLPTPAGPDKAIGRTRYVNDLVLPRMLFGKILRSDRAHALIKRLDISKAEALDGVHAVLTAHNTPQFNIGIGKDNPPLKGDKVRCDGDEIAAVAAESEDIAARALELIEVDYEDLAVITEPEDALADGALLIHDDKPGNLGLAYGFEHGDVAAAEAQSALVLEDEFEVQYVTHCCLGPSCVLADFDAAGKLTIYSQTQYPYNYKMDIAPALDIHPGDIRVIQPPIGGAFGSKLDVYPFEPIAVLLARATRRPVKITFSREEEFIASPTRQPVKFKIRSGVKSDGTLTFRDVDALLNNGGYTSWGATTPYVQMRTFSSHFRVPVVRYQSRAVYTNNRYAGSFRGYGNVQATFVTASHADMLAEALGMDPLAFALKNAQETSASAASSNASSWRTKSPISSKSAGPISRHASARAGSSAASAWRPRSTTRAAPRSTARTAAAPSSSWTIMPAAWSSPAPPRSARGSTPC